MCEETPEKQHQDAFTTVARKGNRKERALQRVESVLLGRSGDMLSRDLDNLQ